MSRGPAGYDHSQQHLTDVQTRRIVARAGDGYAAISWDYPGKTLLEVRVFRSLSGHAETAFDYEHEDGGQTLVYYDVTGSFRDERLENGTTYFYTMFARHPGGMWVHWGNYELKPGDAATTVDGESPSAGETVRSRLTGIVRRVLPAVAVLLCAGALLAVIPGTARGGSAKTPPATASAASAELVATAVADPAVADALAGVTYQTSVVTWGDAGGVPAGGTVTFAWPAAEARNAGGVWPLLVADGTPSPPYTSTDFRVRAGSLAALRVDVLAQERRVIQILPLDGATAFTLDEQTWAPFSWVPLFGAYPWVLMPVYVLVGFVVIARAWRRSRAWNRRLPSMTRHDRQFIGRLVVILFLLAGVAWMVYESVHAAGAPSADPSASGPGDLAMLPLLLFPPAILVAALFLEFSARSHRAAWALVAVLAGAGCIYNLAAAMLGTATNLDLSFYILLGIVCLLAAPRAFSAGRMGWSRNMAPRYG